MKVKKTIPFLIVLTGLFLRIYYLSSHSVPFTYDQGRDLLDIREMVVLKKLRLIGPTTSLHGVFCGPAWYYLILPFYLLSNGHPLSSLGAVLIPSILTPLVFYWLIKDKKAGLLFALFFSFAPLFFLNSTFASNSNPLVYLAPLIVLLLAKFLAGKKPIFLFWALVLLSFGFHFNVVPAGFMTLALLVLIFVFRKTRLFWLAKKAFLGFLLPFLPQFLFDLRHGFLQTKTVLGLFKGQTGSLTTPSGSFFSRFEIWSQVFPSRPSSFLFLLLIIAPLLFFKKKKSSQDELFFLFSVSFLFLVLCLILAQLAPFAIWAWYLEPLKAIMVTLALAGFFLLFRSFPQKKPLFLLFFFFLLILEVNSLPSFSPSDFVADEANLQARITVIDTIYLDAQGRGFALYSFNPHLYDYPYQYLIWWRAKRYDYLPWEFTYLPNQPAYVPAKAEADHLLPAKETELTYLIIEPPESQKEWYSQWRANFGSAAKTWSVGETRIEKL